MRDYDPKYEQEVSDNWTGLPKEEKLLLLIDKLAMKEYSSGLLPFYTIDFFKFKLNENDDLS